jgi:hypothetical protein
MEEIFEFRWGVNPSGYSLKNFDAEENGKLSLISDAQGQAVLGPNDPDRDLEFYTPDEKVKFLHREFASLGPTDEAAIKFVSEYGVLGQTGISEQQFDSVSGGQIVPDFFDAQRKVKLVMDMLKSDKRTNAEASIAFNKNCSARMTMLIDPTKPKRPVAKIIPTTLLSFIWLKVSEDIIGGIIWKKCKYSSCTNHFPVGKGAGTKRREFCHNTNCKIYWHRQNQKEQGNG